MSDERPMGDEGGRVETDGNPFRLACEKLHFDSVLEAVDCTLEVSMYIEVLHRGFAERGDTEVLSDVL